MRNFTILTTFLIFFCQYVHAQNQDKNLTIDRLFTSREFSQKGLAPINWIEKGEAYVIVEPAEDGSGTQLIRYQSRDRKKSVFLSAKQLTPSGEIEPLSIEEFSLSEDESKVLIFNNSKRVWRSNTKGDYWVYDRKANKLTELGTKFPSSSLMFAKFSADNKFVAYVVDFNLYLENFSTGEIRQLTKDGTSDIINGTFDWVYEEEFGCRDGFRWNGDGTYIAYWQLDASDIGTFYMIDNLDSNYSRPIPEQYPKVGEDPSSCRVGLLEVASGKTTWIKIPGGPKENYIPRMQWINEDLLLIQQINRKQNHLTYYLYTPSEQNLSVLYEESEDTWVDISYPDISSSNWNMRDLVTVKNGGVLRMSEIDGWRHLYYIDIKNGKKQLLTPGKYDVAETYSTDGKYVYFNASPFNSTQRYLYRVGVNGKGDTVRVTPSEYEGVNTYDVSPDGKYAIHSHSSHNKVSSARLVNLPDHKIIATLVDNSDLEKKMSTLNMPETRFFKVTTPDGVKMDGRMTVPPDFDENKKYPVLFHVYGEPAGQTATDTYTSLYDIMIAQKGYIIIDMDNRGTPCLKGSEWRKSIYRKIGVLNSHDQAMAAKEVLKWDFVDPNRIAVWGWSGGGSMTQNLMFRYPDIYQTGMAVAGVTNQLNYDNIYQERYMGLPQENMDDFIEGSPITYASGLKGSLLLVHGTGDDNVHYQNLEQLVDELIRQNKQFTMMAYPNRSHGIYERPNTRRHLYTLLTNFLIQHTEPGGKETSTGNSN